MPDIYVNINVGSSPVDLEAIQGVFAKHQVDGVVSANYMAFSEGVGLTTIVEVAALVAFFESFVGAAGEDAWRLVKAFFSELASARTTSLEEKRVIDFRFEDGKGTRIHFRSDAPDEAYQPFTDGTFRPGFWYEWNDARGVWEEIDPRA